MWLIAVLTALAAATGPSGSAVTQADPKLIRVFVHTEDLGQADELAARLQSVKDLSDALRGKKKVLVLVPEEDQADVVVEVRGRALTVPRVVMGVGARPGEPPGGGAPARVVQLSASVGESETFKNKNSPLESQMGWKSAADDIAKQIEKWITDRRAAILAAR
jgi:hypothetical protein